MVMKRSIRAATFAACLVALSSARAGLTGDGVLAEWFYTTHHFADAAIVGPGVEIPNKSSQWPGGLLDFGDDYIEYKTLGEVGLGAGVKWIFSSLDFGSGIGNVLVTTNFKGWDDKMLSFTKDSITVNYFHPVEYDEFNGMIRFTLLPVPEPGTFALLLAGLLPLWLRWRPKALGDRRGNHPAA
jgi:hypothetical protein